MAYKFLMGGVIFDQLISTECPSVIEFHADVKLTENLY